MQSMKKPATSIEKSYMRRIKEQDCIACGASAPCDCHHIREGQGVGMRASNFLTIPLCKECHQGEFSIHMDKRNFENVYGSELTLLAKTIGVMNV